MKSGIEMIVEERKRQIEVEGYTAQHDSQHPASEFAYAIIAYAEAAKVGINCRESGITDERYISMAKSDMGRHFPWGEFKTTTDIRDLTKVGALAAALIDRLQGEVTVEGEEPVSEDLEQEINAEWNCYSKDGQVGCINRFSFELIARHFANWQKEQKPAEWSEEDKRISDAIIKKLRGSDALSVDLQSAICWIESVKDRTLLQPKQEWSEEDIEMIDWLIRCCEKEHKELCNDRYGHQDIVSDLKRDCRKKWDWFESLKNKVVPHSQWQPSEEHYELEEFAKIVRGNLTGISKAVQKLFEAKYLQLTGNKMYGGFKD